MKILTITAAEEKRGATAPGAASEEMRIPSFAERLGESLVSVQTPLKPFVGDDLGPLWGTQIHHLGNDDGSSGVKIEGGHKGAQGADPSAKRMKYVPEKMAPMLKLAAEQSLAGSGKGVSAQLSPERSKTDQETDLLQTHGKEDGLMKALAAKTSETEGEITKEPISSQEPRNSSIADRPAEEASCIVAVSRGRLAPKLSEELLQEDLNSLSTEPKTSEKKPEHVKHAKQDRSMETSTTEIASDSSQGMVTAPVLSTAIDAIAPSGKTNPPDQVQKAPVLVGVQGTRAGDRMRVRSDKATDAEKSSPADESAPVAKKDIDSDLRHAPPFNLAQEGEARGLTSQQEHVTLVQDSSGHGASAIGIQDGTGTVTKAAFEKISSPDVPVAKSQGESSHQPGPLYAPDEQRTLTTTPTSIEVGVSGGTHGWLKVRAELGTDGTVHASMASTSNAEAETLRRELPSITSYLQQEHVTVSSVVVHAPSNSMNMSDLSSGGQGAHRGTSQNMMGSGDSRSGSVAKTLEEAADESGGDDWASVRHGRAGGWLSIRA